MQLTFLGTSSHVPTKERNHTGIFLRYKNEGILVDCGEGTQRQLKIAGIKLTKITRILITHWHGDHVLGLPGLLQTMNDANYRGKLEIYGPKGTKILLKKLLEVFPVRINMDVTDISKVVFLEAKEFRVEARPLKHSIPVLGYRFVEKDRRNIHMSYISKLKVPAGPLLGKLQGGKVVTFKGKKISLHKATKVVPGKKISFIFDTMPCKNAELLSKDVDVLISESTFDTTLEKKSVAYRHTTAKQAAVLAKKSKAKKLLLTHMSPRYKTPKVLEQEAKKIFKNTACAKDFMVIEL